MQFDFAGSTVATDWLLCLGRLSVPRCRLHCSEWKSGNATACVLAKENGGTHRRCGGGVQRKRLRIVRTRCGWVRLRTQKTVATSSSAMDVGSPSNLVRLWHIGMEGVHVRVVTDTTQTDSLAGESVCPHTAVGLSVAEKWPGKVVVVRTADAIKFEEKKKRPTLSSSLRSSSPCHQKKHANETSIRGVVLNLLLAVCQEKQ